MRKMPAPKFTPDARAGLVERVALGVSLAAAARSVSIDPRTVRGWIQRGRHEGEGDYFDFSAAIDDARERADEDGRRPMTEEEAREHLEAAIRGGSLRAIEVWLKRYGREEADTPSPSGLDALDGEAELATQGGRRAPAAVNATESRPRRS